jgi:hypothetical protein
MSAEHEETIEIEPSERFLDAAREWGDRRMMDDEEAMATKAEQALLEIEHLVSGRTEVEFAVEGETIRYDPSPELAAFLDEQAENAGIDREAVCSLYVNLFARVFLNE